MRAVFVLAAVYLLMAAVACQPLREAKAELELSKRFHRKPPSSKKARPASSKVKRRFQKLTSAAEAVSDAFSRLGARVRGGKDAVRTAEEDAHFVSANTKPFPRPGIVTKPGATDPALPTPPGHFDFHGDDHGYGADIEHDALKARIYTQPPLHVGRDADVAATSHVGVSAETEAVGGKRQYKHFWQDPHQRPWMVAGAVVSAAYVWWMASKIKQDLEMTQNLNAASDRSQAQQQAATQQALAENAALEAAAPPATQSPTKRALVKRHNPFTAFRETASRVSLADGSARLRDVVASLPTRTKKMILGFFFGATGLAAGLGTMIYFYFKNLREPGSGPKPLPANYTVPETPPSVPVPLHQVIHATLRKRSILPPQLDVQPSHEERQHHQDTEARLKKPSPSHDLARRRVRFSGFEEFGQDGFHVRIRDALATFVLVGVGVGAATYAIIRYRAAHDRSSKHHKRHVAASSGPPRLMRRLTPILDMIIGPYRSSVEAGGEAELAELDPYDPYLLTVRGIVSTLALAGSITGGVFLSKHIQHEQNDQLRTRNVTASSLSSGERISKRSGADTASAALQRRAVSARPLKHLGKNVDEALVYGLGILVVGSALASIYAAIKDNSPHDHDRETPYSGVQPVIPSVAWNGHRQSLTKRMVPAERAVEMTRMADQHVLARASPEVDPVDSCLSQLRDELAQPQLFAVTAALGTGIAFMAIGGRELWKHYHSHHDDDDDEAAPKPPQPPRRLGERQRVFQRRRPQDEAELASRSRLSKRMFQMAQMAPQENTRASRTVVPFDGNDPAVIDQHLVDAPPGAEEIATNKFVEVALSFTLATCLAVGVAGLVYGIQNMKQEERHRHAEPPEAVNPHRKHVERALLQRRDGLLRSTSPRARLVKRDTLDAVEKVGEAAAEEASKVSSLTHPSPAASHLNEPIASASTQESSQLRRLPSRLRAHFDEFGLLYAIVTVVGLGSYWAVHDYKQLKKHHILKRAEPRPVVEAVVEATEHAAQAEAEAARPASQRVRATLRAWGPEIAGASLALVVIGLAYAGFALNAKHQRNDHHRRDLAKRGVPLPEMTSIACKITGGARTGARGMRSGARRFSEHLDENAEIYTVLGVVATVAAVDGGIWWASKKGNNRPIEPPKSLSKRGFSAVDAGALVDKTKALAQEGGQPTKTAAQRLGRFIVRHRQGEVFALSAVAVASGVIGLSMLANWLDERADNEEYQAERARRSASLSKRDVSLAALRSASEDTLLAVQMAVRRWRNGMTRRRMERRPPMRVVTLGGDGTQPEPFHKELLRSMGRGAAIGLLASLFTMPRFIYLLRKRMRARRERERIKQLYLQENAISDHGKDSHRTQGDHALSKRAPSLAAFRDASKEALLSVRLVIRRWRRAIYRRRANRPPPLPVHTLGGRPPAPRIRWKKIGSEVGPPIAAVTAGGLAVWFLAPKIIAAQERERRQKLERERQALRKLLHEHEMSEHGVDSPRTQHANGLSKRDVGLASIRTAPQDAMQVVRAVARRWRNAAERQRVDRRPRLPVVRLGDDRQARRAGWKTAAAKAVVPLVAGTAIGGALYLTLRLALREQMLQEQEDERRAELEYRREYGRRVHGRGAPYQLSKRALSLPQVLDATRVAKADLRSLISGQRLPRQALIARNRRIRKAATYAGAFVAFEVVKTYLLYELVKNHFEKKQRQHDQDLQQQQRQQGTVGGTSYSTGRTDASSSVPSSTTSSSTSGELRKRSGVRPVGETEMAQTVVAAPPYQRLREAGRQVQESAGRAGKALWSHAMPFVWAASFVAVLYGVEEGVKYFRSRHPEWDKVLGPYSNTNTNEHLQQQRQQGTVGGTSSSTGRTDASSSVASSTTSSSASGELRKRAGVPPAGRHAWHVLRALRQVALGAHRSDMLERADRASLHGARPRRNAHRRPLRATDSASPADLARIARAVASVQKRAVTPAGDAVPTGMVVIRVVRQIGLGNYRSGLFRQFADDDELVPPPPRRPRLWVHEAPPPSLAGGQLGFDGGPHAHRSTEMALAHERAAVQRDGGADRRSV
ncbi:uncharacterized protein SRS1_16578 [Sporisorium reilianum f. sp. reilianum]|uniref:Uncharacterized protein n=1 Tax=Sporisorium reilianum f. sp. reilianum TaxID=72559 RepID=A0A2N8UD01_9BASI|nr:uncharacterized protein SRS1_16578 [Sporisorium reilianum f. sp. reilianum]